MAALKVETFVTPEEYLRREELSLEKHEYLAGRVYAMAGGSWSHNVISANLTFLFVRGLAGTSCTVVNSDQRVRVRESGLFTYPDLSVVCGPPDLEGSTLLNPTLLIEVASPSTEAYDRGEKFAHYQRLESLQAMVFVAQDRPHIQVYARRDKEWASIAEAASLDAVVVLEAIGINLSLADVYNGVAFPEMSPRLGALPNNDR